MATPFVVASLSQSISSSTPRGPSTLSLGDKYVGSSYKGRPAMAIAALFDPAW
ncbi:unnamed protein product [Periconia digitata]|uniref:Uncharacterized protein n=1 Tax=Periconia digitata TaxID=1303443 RepID=A0A9W4U8M4_9PLEO|nr:unnamed protein product [Periconia digitata]